MEQEFPAVGGKHSRCKCSLSLYSPINLSLDKQNTSLLNIPTPCRTNSNLCCLGLSLVSRRNQESKRRKTNWGGRESRHSESFPRQGGSCPSEIPGFFLLDFTRGSWEFCWLVCLDVYLLCSSQGQDYSVFFIFVFIHSTWCKAGAQSIFTNCWWQ